MYVHDSRQVLIYLAIKYEGDAQKMITAMELREDLEVPDEEIRKVCDSLECKTITFLDYDFPQKLKKMFHPPLVLFYYGDISLIDDNRRKYGVVGSRDYDEYSKEVTESLIKDLGRDKVVVSGLARGIDAVAHQAAINNKTRTIAVLGSGIDNCYPSENKELYEIIKKDHLVISEYPGQTVPDASHFPLRNRIVVALSDALIVPQVNSEISGTTISVNLASQTNKPLFVVPHPFFSKTHNNYLINEGACMALSAQQILEELHWE